MTISCWMIFRMRNVSNRSCRANQNTHFIFSNFFPKVDEIMSKNVVEPERPQMTIWRPVACCIIKATRAQAHACARAPTHTHAHVHAHTEIGSTFLLFHGNRGFVIASQCTPYVVGIMSDCLLGWTRGLRRLNLPVIWLHRKRLRSMSLKLIAWLLTRVGRSSEIRTENNSSSCNVKYQSVVRWRHFCFVKGGGECFWDGLYWINVFLYFSCTLRANGDVAPQISTPHSYNTFSDALFIKYHIILMLYYPNLLSVLANLSGHEELRSEAAWSQGSRVRIPLMELMFIVFVV